jgi:hypothetical protein
VAGHPNNERFNIQFSEELMEMKLRMQLLIDAINNIDTAMRGTFDLLIDQGLLPPDAAGVKQYQKTMTQLRKLGLPSEPVKNAAQVKCPNCKTMLRVAGQPGDRCEWCGHIF